MNPTYHTLLIASPSAMIREGLKSLLQTEADLYVLGDVVNGAEALAALMTESVLYREESETSRERALRFVNSLSPGRLEEYLRSLTPAAGTPTTRRKTPAAVDLAELSPEKRSLLLERLRHRHKAQS